MLASIESGGFPVARHSCRSVSGRGMSYVDLITMSVFIVKIFALCLTTSWGSHTQTMKFGERGGGVVINQRPVDGTLSDK